MDLDDGDDDVRSSGEVLQTSVALYFPVFIGAWLLFELIRMNKEHIFENANRCHMPEGDRHRWFAWMPFVMSVPDKDIYEAAGLDALVFLRFLRLCQKVALLCAAWSVVLCPLYAFSATWLKAERVASSDLNPTGSQADEFAEHQAAAVNRLDESDPVERITIANLGKDDWRLYFTLASCYCISIYVMVLLFREYGVYTKWRHEFLSKKAPQQYTVVVTDIVEGLRQPETLKAYMDYLFPDAVHGVYIGVETSEVEKLIAERESNYHYLAAQQCKYKQRKDRAKKRGQDVKEVQRPQIVVDRKIFGVCYGGENVDGIKYYKERISELTDEINDEREDLIKQLDRPYEQSYGSFDKLRSWKVLRQVEKRVTSRWNKVLSKFSDSDSNSRSEKESLLKKKEQEDSDSDSAFVSHIMPFFQDLTIMRSCAFITFRKLRSAHAAQQMLQVQNPTEMRVRQAPHINDVLWDNFGMPHRERAMWKLISLVLTFFIVLFWTIPTTFIASLTNVDVLCNTFKFVDKMVSENPWQILVLEQIAPLVFSTMQKMANKILRFLSTREGHLSVTEIDASLFSKSGYFQIFQMFFVSVVSGSLLSQLVVLLDRPKRVLYFLGSSIAGQSMMFISFIIVQICIELPSTLLRISPVLTDAAHYMLAPMHAQVPERIPWMGLVPLNYSSDIDPPFAFAQQYLVLLLVLVFAPIAPLVSYFGGVYFFATEIVYRRYFFFVHSENRSLSTMGVFWPPLFGFIVLALIVSQLTLLGLLSLKSAGWIPYIFAGLLPLGTIIFYWYVEQSYDYPRAAENLPLDQACDLDEDRDKESFDFLDGVYKQPAMVRTSAAEELKIKSVTKSNSRFDSFKKALSLEKGKKKEAHSSDSSDDSDSDPNTN